MLIIADAIATTLVLARDALNVSAVFDAIEPLARELAERGRTPGGRRAILKRIGNALLVQQRVSDLVAVAEKPDIPRKGLRRSDWRRLAAAVLQPQAHFCLRR